MRTHILPSFCADENKADEWLLVCECGVFRLNKCVNFDTVHERPRFCENFSNLFGFVDRLDLDTRIKVFQSNDQFKFTRWVREMCLMVGLWPFMIICSSWDFPQLEALKHQSPCPTNCGQEFHPILDRARNKGICALVCTGCLLLAKPNLSVRVCGFSKCAACS